MATKDNLAVSANKKNVHSMTYRQNEQVICEHFHKFHAELLSKARKNGLHVCSLLTLSSPVMPNGWTSERPRPY